MLISSAIVVLLMVGGIGLLWVEIGRGLPKTAPPDAALPVLLHDLRGDVDQSRQRFSDRVRHHFPPGTETAYLRTVLQQEGFSINGKDQLEWANFEQRGFPCVRDWTISWRRNSTGKADDIKGTYSLGCL